MVSFKNPTSSYVQLFLFIAEFTPSPPEAAEEKAPKQTERALGIQ